MIKIVVDARTMGSQPSGIGFYLFDFLKELIRSDNFQFYLLTDVAESEQMEFMKNHNIPVICYGSKVFRSVNIYGYFRFVKKYLYHQQPEIFWEPNNLLPISLKRFKGKIVLTIHDLFPITNPEYFSLIYQKYFRWGVTKSVQMADALLFNSNESRQAVIKYFPKSENRVKFVSYLIVRSEQNESISNGQYFLYIGNLERRKGTDLLLKAFERYSCAGGEWPLYIGGYIREKEIEGLLHDIKERNDRVHYLGYLSQKEKEKRLAACGCFVFPSKAEGFGIPPLEAIKYNKKVITSNLSIFNEILHGHAVSFDIKGTEREQIENLCHAMLKVSASDPTEIDASGILKCYNFHRLTERLEKFLINMEDYVEDSI